MADIGYMDVLAESLKEFFKQILQRGELVPLLLLLGLTAVLMWTSRRKLRQSACPPKRSAPLRDAPLPPPGSKEQIRRDLESLIAELEQLSRKITAEIDTRFAKLESAMHDADRRIAALHRLTLHQQGELPARMSQPQAESPGSVSDRPEDRYALIYELTDVGFSPVEIARDLGRTPGEVELILNLRNKGQSMTSGPKP